MIYSSINHDRAHPSHQDHLHIFRLRVLEFVEVLKNFYIAIVHHIHCFLVSIDISEHYLQAISIVAFVELSLLPRAVLYTSIQYVL